MELKKNSYVTFDNATHMYVGNNFETFEGITGILHKYIFPDMYSDVSEATLRKAAERGSAIHKALECFDNGVEQELTEEIELQALASYKTILTENTLHHAVSEYLVSDNVHWASCIDKVYLADDGSYHLADIKTTYTLNEEYVSWQLSIYAYLFELQNPGVRVGDLFAIWLRGEKYKFVKVERKEVEAIKALLDAAKDNLVFINPYAKETLDIPDELSELEEALEEAIAKAAEWGKVKDELTQQVKSWIAEHEKQSGKTIDKIVGSRISVCKTSSSTKEKFDEARFKAECPTTYHNYIQYVKSSPQIRITINKEKKNDNKD